MPQPLVIAYHLIWTVYGAWLPNDPRGSGSRSVRSETLVPLGKAHYGRKPRQPPRKNVREFYEQADSVLQHDALRLSGHDVTAVAVGFGDAVREQRYTCYACAVMPDHVHLVIRKHRDDAETMCFRLKESSAERLVAVGLRKASHPVWAGGVGWKVFLDHPDEVTRTVRYVEQNPIKEGLEPQRWPFVTPYDGWPLHAGHSPNSPYAQALRAAGRYPR